MDIRVWGAFASFIANSLQLFPGVFASVGILQKLLGTAHGERIYDCLA